jgi:hypothetical protein
MEMELSDALTESNLQFNPGGIKMRILIKVMRSLKQGKENLKIVMKSLVLTILINLSLQLLLNFKF